MKPVATPSQPSGAQRPVPAQQAPFFVLGCVRSGTTMLRDALRMHPHLACPEETHFFRWGEPFGSWFTSLRRFFHAVMASGVGAWILLSVPSVPL